MAAGSAPFQCASEIDPQRRREEEPAEALYGLAEQFKARGERAAQVTTLRYIVKRYPSSRFAEMARLDLDALPDVEVKAAEPPGDEAGKAAASDRSKE